MSESTDLEPSPPAVVPRTELVTLIEAKAHLRVVHEFDDADIELKLRAAEEIAVEFLDRAVFPSVEALTSAVAAGTAGPEPMVCNFMLRAGILLILGDLFANREDTVTGTIATQLPTGARQCLRPLRRMGA
ncbi:head-tail connector protein [Comamonas sp.]|uniref:head-tail connector protein n=1 Tax=Comamonas sp. TaxID=34028 RepID=UPI0025891A0D|nr:head-tail connector protein [Comamonas sp.]